MRALVSDSEVNAAGWLDLRADARQVIDALVVSGSAAVAAGGDRQELHEVIRKHSHAVTQALKQGALRNDLLELLGADPAFARVDIAGVVAQGAFTGRAAEQVDEFLAEEVEPALAPYLKQLGQQAELHV